MRDRAGNTLPLVAAGLAPLLALVGGGIDMSRSYLSETRLQQACDAGVLAARKTLGATVVATDTLPADVEAKGKSFFRTNFKNGDYGSAEAAFSMTLEDNNAISGAASASVPTTIMRLFGKDAVDVSVDCSAQLNFSNTDVMMVLDVTGSMNETNEDDNEPKIEILRQVVKDFHGELEGAKGPGIRLRYGFVPYSTNVNVGHLLADDWVTDTWTYQSREVHSQDESANYWSSWENFVKISGTYAEGIQSSYDGTWHAPSNENGNGYYSCDTPAPANTTSVSYTVLSVTTEPYAGPPAGTITVQRERRVISGTDYWVARDGATCRIKFATYDNYIDEYDKVSKPYASYTVQWNYAPLSRDVINWRSQTAGCIEERSTYEITDYDAVDFTRALDLDLDRLPDASDPDTQWRPMYPDIIYARKIGDPVDSVIQVAPKVSSTTYFRPAWEPGLTACPAPARKLAEMTAADIADYVDAIEPRGATYHDIGMIWGGRLISHTGLFASDNVDVGGRITSRHLIFLTDGETRPFDLAYSSYGLEPLDRRRRDPDSPALGLSHAEVIEKRFGVACSEVKKRNVTVWVISFGTGMTDMLRECAGDNHAFLASNAEELSETFSRIAKQMGDLRIEK